MNLSSLSKAAVAFLFVVMTVLIFQPGTRTVDAGGILPPSSCPTFDQVLSLTGTIAADWHVIDATHADPFGKFATNGNDTLHGYLDGMHNYIRGLGGNDTIYGGHAGDVLCGDDGSDRIFPGALSLEPTFVCILIPNGCFFQNWV